MFEFHFWAKRVKFLNSRFQKMLDFDRLQYPNYPAYRKLRGGQWRDNVHILNLMPSSSLCDHWLGHSVAPKSALTHPLGKISLEERRRISMCKGLYVYSLLHNKKQG